MYLLGLSIFSNCFVVHEKNGYTHSIGTWLKRSIACARLQEAATRFVGVHTEELAGQAL